MRIHVWGPLLRGTMESPNRVLATASLRALVHEVYARAEVLRLLNAPTSWLLLRINLRYCASTDTLLAKWQSCGSPEGSREDRNRPKLEGVAGVAVA
jgi:hypothetical protein